MAQKSGLELLQASPRGSYVVLRVLDLEASADFYRSLGLELTREQHGDGPVHYSFPLSPDVVCELYPLRVPPSTMTTVRLGFVVADAAGLRESLTRAGRTITDGPTPNSFIVVDPNGNYVEVAPPTP